MKNKLYPVILLLSSVFLVQGESTGQISIGIPQTTSLTTTTIPSLQIESPWTIAVIIFLIIIAYAAKRYL